VGVVAKLGSVGVSLGGTPILRDVDFTLEPGDVVGVSGPNGAGKTTLLRTLATLIRPSSGAGEVLGADINSDAVFGIRRSIGMIGHRPALVPELTLRENLVHMARLAGAADAPVDTALEAVGLDAVGHRPALAASFGMQRRVEVAHILLARPALVLLDEAVAGLDAEAANMIDALTKRAVGDGGGVVMVSHDRSRLETACRRALTLTGGRLKAQA